MPQHPKKLPKLPKDLLSKIEAQREVDYETVLKLNAALLDCLYRLSLSGLDDGRFDLVESRLRQTPAFVEGYLYLMWKTIHEQT